MPKARIGLQTLFIACLFLISGSVFAGKSYDQKHIKVSLRMIGHQVLLSNGDSTTPVLPIIEEDNRYRIQFQSDWSYNPEILVSIVDSVVNATNLADSYIMEVEACKSGEVVYSYKMDNNTESSIVPCQGRIQPRGCYSLLFTLVGTANSEASLYLEGQGEVLESSSKSNKLNYLLALIPVMLILTFIFIIKKNKKAEVDQDIMHLGNYRFNKRNAELRFDNIRTELTGKEAELLQLLFNHANSTVEKENILQKVWGDEGDYIGRTLDVFISKLRKKLELDTSLKIVNIRGVGYKLVVN